MTLDDYRAGLFARQQAQLAHAAVVSLADAAITLSCPGRRRSGRATCRAAAGAAPDRRLRVQRALLDAVRAVVTVPLMSVGGMPVGVQLMGQQHEDARMTGLARWLTEIVKRVAQAA